MPVTYSERKKRRKRLAQALPPDLRERIALRHVEAVSQFPPGTQRTLAKALEAGVRAPAAIAFLKENPEALLGELVGNCNTRRRSRKKEKIMEDGKPESDQDASRTQLSGSESSSEPARSELTDLLAYCYPDMPQITAQAMATSELIAGVLAIIQAQEACLAMPQAESDFVLVVLCGLASRTTERLDQLVSQKPAYQQALQQSGVLWPGLDAGGRRLPAAP